MQPEPNGERIPTQGRIWEARGEQSEPRTAENAPQNQSVIGRKRFTLSALSSGEVSKGGGAFHIIMNPNS